MIKACIILFSSSDVIANVYNAGYVVFKLSLFQHFYEPEYQISNILKI